MTCAREGHRCGFISSSPACDSVKRSIGVCQVYFLPVAVDLWTGDGEVPMHPALRMVANSEQFLTSRYRCQSWLPRSS